MKTTTTHEQLLHVLYNETDNLEKQTFDFQLLVDADLYDEYYTFKYIANELDAFMLQPKPVTIDKILAYAAY